MKLEVTLNEDIQDNIRKIQNTNNRDIFHFDNICNMKKPRKSIRSGHFEKVDQKVTNYFYVSDDKPSGVLNSFVVSPGEALGIYETLPSNDDMNIRSIK